VYLIDGNNVMGQRVGWHRDKPAARRRLLAELARLARSRKVSLSAFFDGAPEPHFPDGASFQGVKVYYARPGSDADSRIVEFVEESVARERNRKGLVVVTSDNKLAAQVRARGVRVVRSGEFRRLLDALPPETSREHEARVRGDEMGEWMRYFGVDEDEAGDEDE
jgi:predicted RNA-binding protein with PIN domain